ncbi:hypothetical protein ACFFLM_26415 [Deinococcus oregonensis]|uniref:CopG family transcriptional regulator n=1 Tax=Deinococcus oregonensis TaxID=1805970 RepID=A0ABV6B701_9DEIO
MSAEAKKPSRFGNALKGVRDLTPSPAELPAPAVPLKDDTAQEPFSCTLSRGMKRKLKKASADEGRKQYLIVEQALAEYLSRHHPKVE